MTAILSIPVEIGHLALAAADMREADQLEVLASDGHRPAEALLASCAVSEFTRALFLDGELAAVFGVRKLETGVAVPWALTTTAVDRHRIAFWRASKLVLLELRKRYPLLSQCIDARHKQALRWARRLGFSAGFGGVHLCGAAMLPFHHLVLRS